MPNDAPDNDQPIIYQSRLPASEHGVRRALSEVRHRLAEFGLDNDALELTELVVAEALNNIVEHALAGIPNSQIGLAIRSGPDGLSFNIEDQGAEMPNQCLPKGAPANLDVATQALPEGGFGWFLIRSLTLDLGYRRKDDWNVLTFRMPIPNAAA